jgi:hypothetical protein
LIKFDSKKKEMERETGDELYIQGYAIMAYSAFLSSYNLTPGVRILFFSTTRYCIPFKLKNQKNAPTILKF